MHPSTDRVNTIITSFFTELNGADYFHNQVEASDILKSVSAPQIAELYSKLVLLITFANYKNSYFKNGKNANSITETERIYNKCHSNEYKDLAFTSELLKTMGKNASINFIAKIEALQIQLISFLNFQSSAFQIIFHKHSLENMRLLFQEEFDLSKTFPDLEASLFRSFDSMDSALGLDYSFEKSQQSSLQTNERIFEGSAESVQSSYSTIFSTLRELNPKLGASFIDLGCGFGRLGLVIGLHRPDMTFAGYEFVEHRISMAKKSAAKLNLGGNINFYTQDLSESSFKIPEVDIYYMYDPFIGATYQLILKQLVQISKNRPISIATKGHAKDWLQTIAIENNWPPPRSFDYGNLNIFTSC